SPGTRISQPVLTLSDLDPVTTDAGSVFESDHEDTAMQEPEYYSPLVYGPTPRPALYRSPPPSAQYTPVFPSLPSGFQWTQPTPQQQWPSQISSFPMTPNVVPRASASPRASSSPQPQPSVSQPQPQPQPSSSQTPDSPLIRNRKRGALVQSLWQDKQPKTHAVDEVTAARAEAEALRQQNSQQAALIQRLQGENSALQQRLTETQDRLLRHEDSLVSLQQAVQALQAAQAAPPAPAPAAANATRAPLGPQRPPRPAAVTAGPLPHAAPADSPMSYAAVTRHGLTAEQLEVIKAMKPPPRPFRARRDQPASDANTPTVRVYFGNMQSCPLGLLKTRLRALRIRTSAIPNFAFVGKSICELLVEASYKDELVAKMEQFTFRHLPNYNPAVPQDPNVTVVNQDKARQDKGGMTFPRDRGAG
ncbi:hypothetical protein EC968_009723, partial [Mortierella alpina]